MFFRTVLPNSPYLQWPYLESNISVSPPVQTKHKCKRLLRECSNFTLLMSYLIEFIAIAVVACMHAVNWGRLHHVFYVILPSSLSDCQIVWLVSKIYRWFCLAVKLKTFIVPASYSAFPSFALFIQSVFIYLYFEIWLHQDEGWVEITADFLWKLTDFF